MKSHDDRRRLLELPSVRRAHASQHAHQHEVDEDEDRREGEARRDREPVERLPQQPSGGILGSTTSAGRASDGRRPRIALVDRSGLPSSAGRERR